MKTFKQQLYESLDFSLMLSAIMIAILPFLIMYELKGKEIPLLQWGIFIGIDTVFVIILLSLSDYFRHKAKQ